MGGEELGKGETLGAGGGGVGGGDGVIKRFTNPFVHSAGPFSVIVIS